MYFVGVLGVRESKKESKKESNWISNEEIKFSGWHKGACVEQRHQIPVVLKINFQFQHNGARPAPLRWENSKKKKNQCICALQMPLRWQHISITYLHILDLFLGINMALITKGV